MSMTILIAPAAIAVGAFVYFVINWVAASSRYRSATSIEKAQAEIDAAKAREDRKDLAERIRLWLLLKGWYYNLTPLVGMWLLLYLVVGVALNLFGVPNVAAVVMAVPVSFGVAFIALSRLSERRRRAFNRQLLQALRQLAGKIEGGVGPQRALEQITPSLPDPLRSEMSATLETTVASKDLVSALKELSVRYPSRALSMVIAAFEMDRDKGARIEPALRQAAEILDREFELASETAAELSQTKMEFYAIIGIIATITGIMLMGGPAIARQAYHSIGGIIILCAFGAWFAFGVHRAVRIFNKARGEL